MKIDVSSFCYGVITGVTIMTIFFHIYITGKSTRYERMDVMGEVKPERLPEWAKEKAQELLHKKRNKDKER